MISLRENVAHGPFRCLAPRQQVVVLHRLCPEVAALTLLYFGEVGLLDWQSHDRRDKSWRAGSLVRKCCARVGYCSGGEGT